MNTTSFNSYLSKHIYANLVSDNDFFRKLNEIVDWYELTFDLKFLANNDRGGRPRYEPVLLFKMLFLSYLYDISDRETEDLCSSHIKCKYFIGLDITEPSPDHSLLSVFRKEIMNKFGNAWINQVFEQIVSSAIEAGLDFGRLQSIDSTHTIADVNTKKDKDRTENQNKEPRDTDAAWGCKGSETKITTKGEKVEVNKYFYGYKSALLAEDNYGLIAALSVSPGNEADIDGGDNLLNRQLTEEQLKRIGTVIGDKAYGCAVLIGILEKDKQIQTAFSLNKQFLKGQYRERWKKYLNDPKRIKARKKRYIVERTNGDLKENHSLRRCRYLGLSKYHFQASMAAIAYNLKKITTIMAGARFKPI